MRPESAERVFTGRCDCSALLPPPSAHGMQAPLVLPRPSLLTTSPTTTSTIPIKILSHSLDMPSITRTVFPACSPTRRQPSPLPWLPRHIPTPPTHFQNSPPPSPIASKSSSPPSSPPASTSSPSSPPNNSPPPNSSPSPPAPPSALTSTPSRASPTLPSLSAPPRPAAPQPKPSSNSQRTPQPPSNDAARHANSSAHRVVAQSLVHAPPLRAFGAWREPSTAPPRPIGIGSTEPPHAAPAMREVLAL